MPQNPAVKMPGAHRPKPKHSLAEFARWYVQKRIAEKLPDNAHEFMLDLVIAVRNARGYYKEYADMLSQVEIDPEGYGEFLTPEAQAAFKPGQKAQLKQLITNEANSYNADLGKTLRLLADAMCRIDETDTAFMAKMDERIFSY